MLTQCPGCETVFRVTSAILRAAHGQVRCGRCSHQFDAIAHLLDNDVVEAAPDATQPPAGQSDASQRAPSPDQSVTEQTQSAALADQGGADSGLAGLGHEQIILEGHRIEISGIYDRLSLASGEHHLESEHIIEEFNIESETWENPFHSARSDSSRNQASDEPLSAVPHSNGQLSTQRTSGMPAPQRNGSPTAPAVDPELDIDDGATEIDDIEVALDGVSLVADLASLDPPTAPVTPATSAASPPLFNARPAGAITEHDFEDSQEIIMEGERSTETGAQPLWRSQQLGTSTGLELDLLANDLANSRTRPSWPWTTASVVLLLLLTGQALHHWRTSLARHASIGPVVTQWYRTLGMELKPEWQVNAYSIKQWGIVSDPERPGTLRVRASVTNTAPFAQPYPILRLTLEDRFGAKVGEREFAPEEYLPTQSSAVRMLDTEASASIDLSLVDPGPDAVGFQFDSCLGDGKALLCAHELSRDSSASSP